MGVAFVIAVVVLAPAVGLVFDRFLFRKIAPANVIAKLVTGISMLVGIPAILSIIFTNSNQYNPPSILFNPDVVYFRIAGTPINGISVTCVVATVVTLVALLVLIRWTSLGLQMRGAVESRRLIELDGVNGGRVVASAWAISGLIAGLAGVLLAPDLRPAAVQRLRRPDGGRLRRRRLGRPPLPADRRAGGHPDGDDRHHPAGLPPGGQHLVLGGADLPAVHRAGRGPGPGARHADASEGPRTRWPPSTHPPPRPPPPSGPPSSTG